jgi:predicted transcriptional regulator
MAEPIPKSIFDLAPDEELEARLDAEAEADVDAGQVVPHERVRAWLARLGAGEKLPLPKP